LIAYLLAHDEHPAERFQSSRVVLLVQVNGRQIVSGENTGTGSDATCFGLHCLESSSKLPLVWKGVPPKTKVPVFMPELLAVASKRNIELRPLRPNP
jgi:hypothetical protein